MSEKPSQPWSAFLGSTVSLHKDTILEELHKVSVYTAIAINYVEMDDDRGLRRSVLQLASFAVHAAETLPGLAAAKESEERLREDPMRRWRSGPAGAGWTA